MFIQSEPKITIRIKDREIGSGTSTIIAGPCTISDYDSLHAVAEQLKKMGIHFLRGGSFKMRTSPQSFQGLGTEGINILQQVGRELDMITVTEIVDADHMEEMSEKIDILLVGTRSMHNYPLLRKLGKISNPVILKRGMGSTINEWLLSAEHIRENGNTNVILCERGIRSFEPATRYTLDLAAIPLAKKLSPFPVLADPSHSSGNRDLILPLSWAALGAGADGLIIETEINPDEAVCDAQQTINPNMLQQILNGLSLLQQLWKKQ